MIILTLNGRLSRRARRLIEALPVGIQVQVKSLKDSIGGNNIAYVILDEIEDETNTQIFKDAAASSATLS